MKLSLTRALMLLVGTALSLPAFAQLSINGYYRVGAADNIAASGTQTAAFFDRIRLNLSFAAPDDMFGFKTRLEVNSWDSAAANSPALLNLFTDKVSASFVATPLVSLKYGQAYAKFLDGTLKLTVGRLDIADYNANQSVGNIYLNNVATDEPTVKGSLLGMQVGTTTGAILQAWPFEGFSAAVTMAADGKAPGLHNFGFDAYYLIPGTGKLLISSQALDDSDLTKSYASAGFSYTGVKGLTASGVVRYYGKAAGKAQALGTVAIVEYNVAPFFVDVAADVDFTNSHFYVEGEAAYAILPQIKVRAYGAYTDSTATAGNGNINVRGDVMASGSKTVNKYLAGFDLVFPVGKAEASIGMAYGDVANIQIPVLIKANF
jgi:hypothetical protein